MIASLIVVGLIAWAMTGAVEDTVRGIRGDKPAGPRKGFRGYLDDRWAALADRHHQNKALLDADGAPSWWTQKRLEGRRKALALGGMRTDEEIERAAWHHRRRIGLIRQGIDPDTVPPPPGAPALKRNRRMMPDRDAHGKYKAPKEKENEKKRDLETTDVIGLTDLDQNDPAPKETATDTNSTEPQDKQPWTPFTDPKEQNMTAGEINNPADVRAYHDEINKALNAATSTIDALTEVTTEINKQQADFAANATASENAAAGMDGLGMTDGATAARSLIESQTAIVTALAEMVKVLESQAAAIADQVEAARPHADAILRAYQAQLTVHDTRQGAGTRNLARDAYLDGDV